MTTSPSRDRCLTWSQATVQPMSPMALPNGTMPMRCRKRPPRTSRELCRSSVSVGSTGPPFRRSQELNDLQIVQALQDLGCTFDYFSRASLAMGEWLQFTVECEAKKLGEWWPPRLHILLEEMWCFSQIYMIPWLWSHDLENDFVNVTYGDMCDICVCVHHSLYVWIVWLWSFQPLHLTTGLVWSTFLASKSCRGGELPVGCRGCGCGGIWWDKVGCKTCGIQGWQMSNDGNLPTQLAVHGSRWRWSRSSKHFNVCFFSKLIAGARKTGKVTQLSKGLCCQKVSYFCW